MRTSSTENLKQNAPYYMLKTKTKKLDNSLQSSREDRNSLNAGSKADSSLSRTSSSSTTLNKPKKPFFDLKQTNTEITKKLERDYLHRNLEENSQSYMPTTTKKERSVSKDRKASEDLVRKILTSPQVKPSSANQESTAKKSENLMKSFSPKFNLDSIYSHKYLLSATKSPSLQSPAPEDFPTPKIEVKEFNMSSATKEVPAQSYGTHSRANSRAPSVGERASSSTVVTNTGSIRSNSKQRDSELSKGDGSTKVFDRLYQEKGLKTLFGKNIASGPNISLKDIQFSRMGELKMKESTLKGPRYDPSSIASPKIVNYWINSSKENLPQSPKPYEPTTKLSQVFSATNIRSPIIAKPIPIKISETFTSHEAPRISRKNSQVFSPNPEVVMQNEVAAPTQEFQPYQSSNQNFIQEALNTNNREILRDSTNYYPEPTESETVTLKPNMRELAAEKLKQLQREIALQGQNISEEEEEVAPYQPTLLKGGSDLKAPLSMIDEGVECSSASHSRKQSRSSILDNQPVHFHYYIQTGL